MSNLEAANALSVEEINLIQSQNIVRLSTELEEANLYISELEGHISVLKHQLGLDYDMQDRRVIDQTPGQSLAEIKDDVRGIIKKSIMEAFENNKETK